MAIIYKNRGLLFIALLVSFNTSHADQIVLRYSQWLPDAHWSQRDAMHPWFDQIAEVTEGRVVVEPSKKPLVPPSQSYQAVVDGKIDLAFGLHGYTPGEFPLTELVEQPFITHHSAHSSAAYWRLWEQSFAHTGMHAGMETMAMHVTAGGNLHMREGYVSSTEDFEGLRIRVPTRVVGRVLEHLGSRTITGQLRALGHMLNTGAVDGTALVDGLALNFGINHYVNSVTHIPGGLYTSSIFVGINQSKWNEISPDDQVAIRAISGLPLSRQLGQMSHETDFKAKVKLQEQFGEKYHTATSEFMSDLKEIFKIELESLMTAVQEFNVDGKETTALYQKLVAEETVKNSR